MSLHWAGRRTPGYEQFWKHCHHVIGKDILKTHGIYWPCMLKAAGFPVFKKLAVHGHWVVQGSKMSKSLGNVVNPLEMKDLIGVDGLRYFLLREMSYGEDANFTEDLVFARYHGELSNNFGNLLNRSISMSRKNFENEVLPGVNQENRKSNCTKCLSKKLLRSKHGSNSLSRIGLWNGLP